MWVLLLALPHFGADAVLVPLQNVPIRSHRRPFEFNERSPWTRLEDWPANDDLHAAGFLAALALSDDSVSLDDFVTMPVMTDKDSRVALVSGNGG